MARTTALVMGHHLHSHVQGCRWGQRRMAIKHPPDATLISLSLQPALHASMGPLLHNPRHLRLCTRTCTRKQQGSGRRLSPLEGGVD